MRAITHLLDTRTVYLCPRLNPDGAELALGDKPRHIRSSTRRYPFDEDPVDGLTIEDVDGDGRVLFMRIPDPHGAYKKCDQDPRLMVARQPGEFGGEYYRLMPEGLAEELRRADDQGQPGRRGARPEPQLPGLLAPGVRAGRRRRLPDQRARGAGDGRLHPEAPEHRRGDQLPHAQRRDPAADGHAERRRHDPRGPVVDQALQRARREADRLSGDQHLARLQVPPEGSHHRHAGLGLRAPRRAVLGRRDLGAEQGSRHHRLQVGRLVPRAPGRGRSEADQVERRAVRRPGAFGLAPVPASAARRGRDRRLGQDELLAQSAAASARTRSGALSRPG